jgi:hypothetical protein
MLLGVGQLLHGYNRSNGKLAFRSVVKNNHENSSNTHTPLSPFDPVHRQFLPLHNLALHIYVSLVHP